MKLLCLCINLLGMACLALPALGDDVMPMNTLGRALKPSNQNPLTSPSMAPWSEENCINRHLEVTLGLLSIDKLRQAKDQACRTTAYQQGEQAASEISKKLYQEYSEENLAKKIYDDIASTDATLEISYDALKNLSKALAANILHQLEELNSRGLLHLYDQSWLKTNIGRLEFLNKLSKFIESSSVYANLGPYAAGEATKLSLYLYELYMANASVERCVAITKQYSTESNRLINSALSEANELAIHGCGADGAEILNDLVGMNLITAQANAYGMGQISAGDLCVKYSSLDKRRTADCGATKEGK